MAVTLDHVKNYLKVDVDEDDELIESLMAAANDYVERTTGKRADGSELCELCVKMLVAHWYENRAVYSSKPGAINVLPHTVTALLTHIAQCEAYPEAKNDKH